MHYMQCMHMRTHQLEDVIKNDPSVLLSSECEYFVRRLSEETGNRADLAEKSIRDSLLVVSRDWSLQLMADVKEGARDTIMILGASRCSRALSLRPDILQIVQLCDINRNRVSSYVKALEQFGLVSLREIGQSEIVSGTELGDLYSDILLGKMELIKKKLEDPIEQFLHGGDRDECFQKLEKFETAFDVAKEAYPKNSLNYGIIDEFHDLFVMLSAAVRNGQKERVESLSRNIYETLETSTRTKLQAEKAGLKPLILEGTGEKVGRGKIFRLVSPKG